MNQRSKLKGSQKPRFESFYFKKLQTQTSISSDYQREYVQKSQILQNEIKKMEKSLHKKNSTFTKTLIKKKQMEKQLLIQRQTLKSRLQEKMRKSYHNMLENRQKSNSSLSNRLKAQHKKVQEIKRLQKTIYNQKNEKAQQYRTNTEKFFINLEEKKIKKTNQVSIDTSFLLRTRKKSPLFSPLSNKVFNQRQSNHERSHNKLNPEVKRPFLSTLRTPRQSILEKQQKKIEQEKAKQNSFLRQYVQKMHSIEQTRKKVRIQKKVPQSTVAKLVNRQYNEQDQDSRKKHNKSSIQQAVSNKGSFSQLYHKKLQQKKDRKSFFLSQSIASGNNIMQEETKLTNKFKLNKLIRETQNELARKENFRYMQKFLQKSG